MTQPKLNGQGLMAALCAAATWGMVGVFVRWLPGWSAFAVLAGRFLVATVAMLPILFLAPSVRHDLTRSLRTPPIWWLSLPAIGGYVLGTTAFQIAPVGEVTLLFTTSPLFIIAYKYVVRLDVKRSEGFGMLLAMAGVSVIMLPQLSSDRAVSWETLAGYLLALGAAGSIALYTLWFNAFAKQNIAPKPINVVFLTCLLGSILSFLCAVFFQASIEIEIDRQVVLVLLGLGILSTALPFLCYTVAAQRLPVLLTTAILLLEPMFAVLFASVALQEIPSLWFGVGSVLVFWGLLSIAGFASRW
ncbi:DMT family transporter [Scytonema millei]|uniref:DMT family transporter n=1 Tax=Scytonema millei VB511283 TaxID=1245923 RepID=A0A9X5E8Q0_9CYAN|nr:DMT family transporter [Scytonema millei]NHC36983.1 DMT family transporter [Scytonema millei VB511283]